MQQAYPLLSYKGKPNLTTKVKHLGGVQVASVSSGIHERLVKGGFWPSPSHTRHASHAH